MTLEDFIRERRWGETSKIASIDWREEGKGWVRATRGTSALRRRD